MTYEQFWEQDSSLVKDYRKAYEIRQEMQNQAAWLQGMYVYEAICDASPILHDFAKRGTKPIPYSAKPYELNPKKREESAVEAARKKSERIRDSMFQYMKQQKEAKLRAALMEDGAETAKTWEQTESTEPEAAPVDVSESTTEQT